MKICNTETDIQDCLSCYGNMFYELTREEIMALLDGKTLADPDFDEYGVVINMKGE